MQNSIFFTREFHVSGRIDLCISRKLSVRGKGSRRWAEIASPKLFSQSFNALICAEESEINPQEGILFTEIRKENTELHEAINIGSLCLRFDEVQIYFQALKTIHALKILHGGKGMRNQRSTERLKCI